MNENGFQNDPNHLKWKNHIPNKFSISIWIRKMNNQNTLDNHYHRNKNHIKPLSINKIKNISIFCLFQSVLFSLFGIKIEVTTKIMYNPEMTKPRPPLPNFTIFASCSFSLHNLS